MTTTEPGIEASETVETGDPAVVRAAPTPGCPNCDPEGALGRVAGREPIQCRVCQRVFRPLQTSSEEVRVAQARPARFGEEGAGDALRIEWPWLSRRSVPLVVGTIVANAVVGGLLAPLVTGLEMGWAIAVFVGLSPVILGLQLLGWAALAEVFNSSVLEVAAGDGRLVVRSGPIAVPAFAARTAPFRADTRSLKQFFVQRIGALPGREANGSPEQVRLMALDGSGARHIVVTGLSVDEAIWLEQRLERFLQIVDVPVGADDEIR